MSKTDFNSIIQDSAYIVVSGNTTAGVPDLVKTARDRFVDPAFTDTDYIEIYADDFNEEDFSNSALSMPMLSEKKVIVIRNASSLKKTQAEFIDELMSVNMVSPVLIIVYADEMQQAAENIRKAKSWFPSAKRIEKKRYDEVSNDDIEEMAHFYGIKLGSTQINRLKIVSMGNAETVKNVLGICWMSNNLNPIENSTEEMGIIENIPVLHYKYLETLMERKKQCIDLYKNIIKWKVMNLDGVIMITLSKIAEKRQIIMAYQTGGAHAVEEASGNKGSPVFYYANRHNQKICKLWSLFEMDNVYNLFYGILREARTVKREHAELLFEQAVIKAINIRGNYGFKQTDK